MHSPDANSNAMLGYGTIVQINDPGNSPGDWHDLDEVFNVTPPSAEVDQIDVTHMRSPGRRREFIDGLIDGGEFSFQINYIPGGDTDDILNAILDLPVGASRRRNWRVIFPNLVMHTFSGNLQTYEPDAPTDDKMTATVTIKVTGAITRGTFS